MYDQVLDVKLTWGDVKPAICEIITLACPKQTSEDLKKRRSNKAKTTSENAVENAETKGTYEDGNASGTYTKESWAAFKTAYENAANAKADATTEELAEPADRLQDAKAKLKKAESETENRTEKPTENRPKTNRKNQRKNRPRDLTEKL